MYLKEFREGIKLTQKEIADKLDIAQAAVARYEMNNVNPTSNIIFKYVNELNANPNFLFLGLEPATLIENDYLSQENQIILQDLSLNLTQDELNIELKKILIDKVLNKFSNKNEKSAMRTILRSIYLEGHIPYRAFLFLYYTFKYISENQHELNNVKSYKNYLIELIQRYNQFSFRNDPMFGRKIKLEISSGIELNCEEIEIKLLLTHPHETIKKLEEKMTPGMVMHHRNKNVKDLFPKK